MISLEPTHQKSRRSSKSFFSVDTTLSQKSKKNFQQASEKPMEEEQNHPPEPAKKPDDNLK